MITFINMNSGQFEIKIYGNIYINNNALENYGYDASNNSILTNYF